MLYPDLRTYRISDDGKATVELRDRAYERALRDYEDDKYFERLMAEDDDYELQ